MPKEGLVSQMFQEHLVQAMLWVMIWVSVGEVGLEMSERIIPCTWISLYIIQHVIYPTIVLLIRRSWKDARSVHEGRPILDGLETGLELWLPYAQILEDLTGPK